MDYEATPVTKRDKYLGGSPKRRNVTHIKVQDGTRLGRKAARRTLRLALRAHRQSIKQLRRDIHKHKLLMKQARLVYKITK